jgi:drug/metabolite transporter (DMT)-like permease
MSAAAASPTAYRLGVLLVLISTLAWSSAGLFARWVELDAWTQLVWRGLFGAVGVLLFAALYERRNPLAGLGRLGRPAWAFAAISAISMVAYIHALNETTVAHVVVIYATVPFVVAAIAWGSLRERPGRSAIVASLAALIGVAVMMGFGADGSWFGDLLAFAMTLGLAVLIVMSRRYATMPILAAAGLSALFSAALALPFAQPLEVSFEQLGLLALFGLVNSALGIVFFALGARLLPAVETALIGTLETPLAPILVWLAFAEIPTSLTLGGGAIVFAAVACHILLSARKSAG